MVQFRPSRLVQGASDQRHETRGGMRWPLRGARRGVVQRRPKLRCARSTDRGSLAEDNRRPGQGTAPPGLSQSKPQTPRAERRTFSAVRGDCMLMRFHTSRMGPWAWLKARRSARPWVSRGWNARLEYGRARAGQRTGTAELCSFSHALPPACGGGWPERSDGVGWGILNVMARSINGPHPDLLRCRSADRPSPPLRGGKEAKQSESRKAPP